MPKRKNKPFAFPSDADNSATVETDPLSESSSESSTSDGRPFAFAKAAPILHRSKRQCWLCAIDQVEKFVVSNVSDVSDDVLACTQKYPPL